VGTVLAPFGWPVSRDWFCLGVRPDTVTTQDCRLMTGRPHRPPPRIRSCRSREDESPAQGRSTRWPHGTRCIGGYRSP